MAKKWFYVTVKKTKVWEIGVEARDEREARNIAFKQSEKIDPDYEDTAEIMVDEVEKYVE